MKKVIFFLLLMGLALATNAQNNSREFTVDLNSKCWLKEHAYSQKMTLPDSLSYGFLGISGYTKDTLTTITVEYRAKQNKEWGPWILMSTPHEGRAIGRQSFSAPPLFEKINTIQIRTSDSLDEPFVLRLFAAPSEKKKS
jgi:hypothetical protein